MRPDHICSRFFKYHLYSFPFIFIWTCSIDVIYIVFHILCCKFFTPILLFLLKFNLVKTMWYHTWFSIMMTILKTNILKYVHQKIFNETVLNHKILFLFYWLTFGGKLSMNEATKTERINNHCWYQQILGLCSLYILGLKFENIRYRCH